MAEPVRTELACESCGRKGSLTGSMGSVVTRVLWCQTCSTTDSTIFVAKNEDGERIVVLPREGRAYHYPMEQVSDLIKAIKVVEAAAK